MTKKSTSDKLSRRKILAASATGLSLATAGCASSTGSSTESSDTEQTATVYTELSENSQTQLQEKDEELRQKLMNESLSRQEAGQQSRTLQAELFNELTNDAIEKAESEGLTVEDELTIQGNPPIILVTGSESAMFDLLESEIITAIGTESEFEDLKEQQQQREQQRQRRQQAQQNQSTENTTTTNESTNQS